MPAAMVTACPSAMPTSKNRRGWAAAKAVKPVPSAMAAVMAQICASWSASTFSSCPNTEENDGSDGALARPVAGSKGDTPWKRSGACSAGA